MKYQTTIIIITCTLINIMPYGLMADEQDMQSRIEELYNALEERYERTRQPLNLAEPIPEIDRLRREVGAERLMAEVFKYAPLERDDERRTWYVVGIATYLGRFVQPDHLIEEMAPLLDQHDTTAEGARRALFHIEGYRPDFREHIRYIKAHGDAVPLAFYQHMYERDTSQTLIAIAQAKGKGGERRRELHWKDHLVETARFRLGYRDAGEFVNEVAEARQALEDMAEDDAWWVRLYAAYRATDRQTGTTLADDELRQNLRDDPHELVADIAGRQEE